MNVIPFVLSPLKTFKSDYTFPITREYETEYDPNYNKFQSYEIHMGNLQ